MTISRIVQLDQEFEKFAGRRLEESYASLVPDARYEKMNEDGDVRSRPILIAIGINWEGRRCASAVEPDDCESASSWKDLLLGSKRRLQEARFPAFITL